ncbi:MAG TPA: 1-acyl-sn-glycerol-3-phosphate acyltransferase [Candidatus Aminicenantes bacterium]|nr:1-acyl-sn-glycerol-3-phosphate acyltransferase [Candidatus Aminicenantes bacterium]
MGIITLKANMKNPFRYMDAYTSPQTVAPRFPSLCFYPWYMRLIFRYRRDVRRGAAGTGYFPARSLDVIRRIEHCGGRFVVTGLNYLRERSGPAVFVSNHMSTLETMVLPGFIHLFMPVTFVVKESLVKGPFFGPIMRSRDPVVVTRRNARADLISVLRDGKQKLKNGISIVLFPQGTRSRAFDSRQFNTLGVKLARSAGVPLIPLALKTDFWGNGLLIRPLGKLHPQRTIFMAFASPLDSTLESARMHEQTLFHIRSHLRDWGLPPTRIR